MMEHETEELHGFDELLRYFGRLRREVGDQFPAPRAPGLSAFLAILSDKASSILTAEVNGSPHVFFRMEYGTGELVDVDAAGDDVRLDSVRVEPAGTLHPTAHQVPIWWIPHQQLELAATIAAKNDYPRTAKELRKLLDAGGPPPSLLA